MFKRLGIFAVLAVCLFAIVIVMGGCDTDPPITPPIDKPPVELPPPAVPEGMVLIPAGTFEMGSEDEQPVHTVHLDAFYMDKYEVTNAQYKAFIDANPQWQPANIEDRFHDAHLSTWDGNNYPAGKADHPVGHVSWYAAMAYAVWAGKRLPTEAEWEYAARGGLAGKKYPWGDAEPTPADANYGDIVGDTTPVGQYLANGYGLYDMAGNVREWCLDAWEWRFYAKSDNSRNPIGGGETVQWLRENFTSISNDDGGPDEDISLDVRIYRDSPYWSDEPTVYTRDDMGINVAAGTLGFRCARSVTP